MPLELHIIRFGEFIKMDADGQLDLKASREILRQLAGACRKRGVHRALLDLREVHPATTPMLAPNDLVTLVNTFHEAGFAEEQRLAVLYAADPHYGARLFALISTLRGWNVKATDSFEDALMWLSEGPSKPGEKRAGTEDIPLNIKQAEAPPEVGASDGNPIQEKSE